MRIPTATTAPARPARRIVRRSAAVALTAALTVPALAGQALAGTTWN